MGLNIAVGGKGGYSKYTQERSCKISQKNKGKKKTDQHKEKLKLIASDGRKKGAGNSNAKKWKLIDPQNRVYNINGNLEFYIQSLNLSRRTLISNLGKKVPDIQNKGRGGFRASSRVSVEKRINSIGWSLFRSD